MPKSSGSESPNNFSLKEMILRLEAKVDKVIDDHERRIRLGERWRWGIPASIIAAVIASILIR